MKLKKITQKAVISEAVDNNAQIAADTYSKFLMDQVDKMIDDSKLRNTEALKTINKEFADIVKLHPNLAESVIKRPYGHSYYVKSGKRPDVITEMTRKNAEGVFDLYADFLEKKVTPKLPASSAKQQVEKIHENIIDISRNIRDYINVLAAITLELTDTQYYQETI